MDVLWNLALPGVMIVAGYLWGWSSAQVRWHSLMGKFWGGLRDYTINAPEPIPADLFRYLTEGPLDHAPNWPWDGLRLPSPR